jgi:hypothetical protein
MGIYANHGEKIGSFQQNVVLLISINVIYPYAVADVIRVIFFIFAVKKSTSLYRGWQKEDTTEEFCDSTEVLWETELLEAIQLDSKAWKEEGQEIII